MLIQINKYLYYHAQTEYIYTTHNTTMFRIAVEWPINPRANESINEFMSQNMKKKKNESTLLDQPRQKKKPYKSTEMILMQNC